MLASLLARHPDISVFDEDQSYELLVSEKSEGVFKVPRWGDLLPGPTWGDPDQQMSRPFQWRGEPMLHMVRNPLDVVASMDRLTMSGGVPWLDRYGIPLLKWRLENDSYSRQQVGWVLDLDEVDGRWAYGAAYWWVKNHAAIRHLDAGRPVKVIVYEGLVAEPTRLKDITDWMGIGEIDVGAPSRLSNAAGGTDPQKIPDPSHIGRGESLPRAIKSIVYDIAGDLYELLCTKTE